MKKAFIYSLLLVWSAICILPVYWVAITSFKSVEFIDKPPGYVPFLDFSPSLDGWRFILFAHNENLVAGFINSTLIAVSATVVTIVVSLMVIYGATRFPPALRWSTLVTVGLALVLGLAAVFTPAEPARGLLLGLACIALCGAMLMRQKGTRVSATALTGAILAVRVLPPATLALPLYILAVETGLRDTLVSMILVYSTINLPVAVWLMVPVLGDRATEQEESAQLEGATHLSILFTILLPMLRARVAAAGLIVFLLCWNEYLFAAYLTADHALTLPPWAVGQLSMKEAQTNGEAEELAHLSAATILMMVPALVFAAFVQRHVFRNDRKE